MYVYIYIHIYICNIYIRFASFTTSSCAHVLTPICTCAHVYTHALGLYDAHYICRNSYHTHIHTQTHTHTHSLSLSLPLSLFLASLSPVLSLFLFFSFSLAILFRFSFFSSLYLSVSFNLSLSLSFLPPPLPLPSHIYTQHLCAHTQAQGLGVGQALLKETEKVAIEAKMQRVMLTVFSHNPAVRLLICLCVLCLYM